MATDEEPSTTGDPTFLEVREQFLRLWGRLGPWWGVPPGTARVYAFLLASAEPVDGESITAELGVSRGGVSTACRELEDWGLIRSERPAGSRRVLYRVEEDPEKVIRGIVRTRKRREWDPILEHVRGWRATLAQESSEEGRVLAGRLREIEGLVGLVDSMADLFLKGNLVPKVGIKALVTAARKRTGKTTKA